MARPARAVAAPAAGLPVPRVLRAPAADDGVRGLHAVSVGYSATFMLQQRLMALTPDDLKGHALGLHSSCMLAMHQQVARSRDAAAYCPGVKLRVAAAPVIQRQLGTGC
jgi:hypothetical protein